MIGGQIFHISRGYDLREQPGVVAVFQSGTPMRTFRNARFHAPTPVIDCVHDAVADPELTLVIDVDTLERSALARVDRVMLLALDSLGRAGVDVVLLAREERARATLVQQGITGARCVRGFSPAPQRAIVVTDDPSVLTALAGQDRGIALGRPELAGANVAAIGDAGVRAMLWWMLEARTRELAA